MPITKLEQMIDQLKSRPPKRVVAAYANDAHTIGALAGALDLGIIEATLVGDQDVIVRVCAAEGIDVGRFTIVHEANEMKAVYKAVELVNQGAGQIIMKGLCSTDKYMRGLLDKEKGLMDPGAILSHVTVIENARYHKLIICADVAVLPAPELKEKIAIVNYMITVAKALGIETPKVAIIAATEQMSYKMQACVDAAIISKMAERGQIKGALVDGPQALDVAVDRESAETKGVKNPVAGDADCLLFPDIEAANVFYKTSTKLAGCELGAMVVGARCPAILSSRGDSVKTKLYSIALAALTAK
ncbi:MAG TPA: phosphate acyltransferase [Thermoanaerobaculaceae bacterium]|nr:phosphate acyltransferase [Thermoanaerobaculaceae bacterium]